MSSRSPYVCECIASSLARSIHGRSTRSWTTSGALTASCRTGSRSARRGRCRALGLWHRRGSGAATRWVLSRAVPRLRARVDRAGGLGRPVAGGRRQEAHPLRPREARARPLPAGRDRGPSARRLGPSPGTGAGAAAGRDRSGRARSCRRRDPTPERIRTGRRGRRGRTQRAPRSGRSARASRTIGGVLDAAAPRRRQPNGRALAISMKMMETHRGVAHHLHPERSNPASAGRGSLAGGGAPRIDPTSSALGEGPRRALRPMGALGWSTAPARRAAFVASVPCSKR
jgi:hypothetical protein